MFMAIIFLVLLMLGLAKIWRFFLESSEDVGRIRMLEPWYWFIFLNLALTLISSNYDPHFVVIGLLIQVAFSVWFAISMAWIIQSCHHKTAIAYQSMFSKGRTVKFCGRCGTRLPNNFHAHFTREPEDSWQNILFQVPPHLFQYIVFWICLSMAVSITLFLSLRALKTPDLQHEAVLVAVIFVVFVPPILYFLGRFRKYLTDTKGLIWFKDLKGAFVIWIVLIALLLCLLHFW
jgi:hypothetical protein